jgi:hypothetical protein
VHLLLSNLTIEHCVFRHNKADGVRQVVRRRANFDMQR